MCVCVSVCVWGGEGEEQATLGIHISMIHFIVQSTSVHTKFFFYLAYTGKHRRKLNCVLFCRCAQLGQCACYGLIKAD